MCLNNIKGPFVAEKDISCYKHFKTEYFLGKERCVSPYRGKLWPIKGVMRSRLKVVKADKIIEHGLHAFVHKKHAEKDRICMSSNIVKTMYIPKGATYYKGTFDGDTCYAANKIMIK